MSQRRRKPLSPYLPGADDGIAPLGYVLEWTPQSHHRHRLDTIDNLRSELLGGEPSGVEQLIVLRGALVSSDVSDALRSLAGVDGAFVEAFARGRPFRPRDKAARWWTWRYPEQEEEKTTGAGRRSAVVLRTAALWLSSPTPVLLVETPLEAALGTTKRHKSAPRLRHQDAATRRSALHQQYGAVAARYPTSPRDAAPVKTLDDELAAAVDHVQEVVLEEMLAELVYERWADALRLAADDDDGRDQRRRRLWSYMAALERNLDDARCCAARHGGGRSVEHGSPAAWTDLCRRAQLRIQQLASSTSACAAAAAAPRGGGDDDNDRSSLDRLAYLGGLLLPVSVVAGVLAIEGRYGPEGAQFWVFWAASAAAAVVTLLVIYLDQLRLDDVWVDVSGGGGAGEEQRVGAAGLGVVVVGAAAAARAWRRERLGWARALKRASGYYRLRGARWIRFESPVREEREGRGEDVVVVVEEER
ncbi:hypothetical protein A9K55_004809 [Cordyceps militaris]|uniref:Uncharacterized protein n=1 Tax=Cordyceps militaris TaxID=73501 RepID=A0A2H4SPR8_CORMI|nr:hypothetical protein A9K55_004809 [Cordyceps militaris]